MRRTARSELAALRAENAALRAENATLRAETAQLRSKVSFARLQDGTKVRTKETTEETIRETTPKGTTKETTKVTTTETEITNATEQDGVRSVQVIKSLPEVVVLQGTCASRMPVPGDIVHRSDDKAYDREGDDKVRFELPAGKAAIVLHVLADGDFKLCNAEGVITKWHIQRSQWSFAKAGTAEAQLLVTRAWSKLRRRRAAATLLPAFGKASRQYMVVSHTDEHGVESDGLLVHEGASDNSEANATRLAVGALVEELEMRNSRLHFALLRGDGPEVGWVDLARDTKPLLVPVHGEGAQISKERSIQTAEREEMAALVAELMPKSEAFAKGGLCDSEHLEEKAAQEEQAQREPESEATTADDGHSEKQEETSVLEERDRVESASTLEEEAATATALRPAEPSDMMEVARPRLPEVFHLEAQDGNTPAAQAGQNEEEAAHAFANPCKEGTDGGALRAEEADLVAEGWERLLDEPMLQMDSERTLRGACASCPGVCKAWRRMQGGDGCACCGRPATEHEDLNKWSWRIRAQVHRFNGTGCANVPFSSGVLPVAALSWEPVDVALYVLTKGRVDPRGAAKRRAAVVTATLQSYISRTGSKRPLISVCIPTTTRRRGHFHELLYRNFTAQTYEPKELVVVDVGDAPSAFLEARARENPQVAYYFFKGVTDSRDVWKAGPGEPKRSIAQLLSTSQFKDAWTLGLKRNVATHLACGSIIAHFDDDDLYSASYLEYMLSQLCEQSRKEGGTEVEEEVRAGNAPAILALSEWHLFDFRTQTFRWMDPKTCPMRESWRKAMIYGYGFKYMYTRKAWEMQRFPDTEDSEDDVFMSRLQGTQGCMVFLTGLPKTLSGLVAHSHHGDNTGQMELDDGDRILGERCLIPKAFERHLPLVQQVAARMQRSRNFPPNHIPDRMVRSL
jgi:hypothetical protein